MTALPSQLSYAATPADSTPMVAAEIRNPLASVLTTVNSLITALGAGVSGQVLGLTPSATAPVFPPGYELGYTEFTSNVTIAGLEGTPTNVVAAPSVTFDGAAVIIEFFCVQVSLPAAGGAIIGLSLWDTTAGTDLGRITQINNFGTAAGGTSVCARRKITPAAGARTYTIRGWQSGAGNGTALAGVGGAATVLPGYIRITKA